MTTVTAQETNTIRMVIDLEEEISLQGTQCAVVSVVART